MFWAQDAVAKRLSGESGGNGAAARSAALAAERAWTRVVEVAEEGLPALHHEKVVYMDALAQARVVAGDAKVGEGGRGGVGRRGRGRSRTLGYAAASESV